MATKGFDYDVIVIGSGFGGSVAAMRAAEKGYRVGVHGSRQALARRGHPQDQLGCPQVCLAARCRDVRHPAHGVSGRCAGAVRRRCRRRIACLRQTLYVPPKKFFDAPEWAGITDWADELAPYIDQALRMLGVVTVPYMDTQVIV